MKNSKYQLFLSLVNFRFLLECNTGDFEYHRRFWFFNALLAAFLNPQSLLPGYDK